MKFSKVETQKCKGVAICLLLFHHLFYNTQRAQLGGMDVSTNGYGFIQQIAISARVCVYIFAFLSAYGLTIQFRNKKAENNVSYFVFRRWIALMVPFWFVYVIIFAFSFFLFKNPLDVYQKSLSFLVIDAFGWADFLGTPTLSGVWWYMCFAQVLLFIIPVIIIMCNRLGWSTYIIVFLSLQYLNPGITSNFGGIYTNYLLVIILGVLCAEKEFFEKTYIRKESWVKRTTMFILTCMGIVLTLYMKVYYQDVDVWKLGTVFLSFASLLIVYFSFNYVGGMAQKILCFLGKHSGNIFLIHAFFYTYYIKIVYWSENVLVTWGTLLCLSLISSIIIEKVKVFLGYDKLFNKSILVRSKDKNVY